MGQVRHGSATTTHAVRAAIQRSQASLAQLSRELGINPKTVAKWRKRASVEDMKTGPTEARSTVLTATEVAQTYGLRWQVELLFKGLKHHGRLDQLPSGKQEVVECFIWASVLTQLLSEALYRRVRAETPPDRHTPLLRWAAVLSRFSRT